MSFPSILLFLFSFVILFHIRAQKGLQDKSWDDIVYDQPAYWYGSEEAIRIANNVLIYQRNIGGWPKNIPMHHPLTKSEKRGLRKLKSDGTGATIDNSATVTELDFLSKVYATSNEKRFKDAFLRGVEYLLEAQYENGGWPQYYPLREGYYTHITFNDNAMVNVMKVMKSIAEKDDRFSIELGSNTVQRAQEAFDKGVAIMLNTQYRQHGVLTVWCAQHDEETFLPAQARSYELPSLSGSESVDIVLLLMDIDGPSLEIRQAIQSAVAWFEKVKIEGIRIQSFTNSDGKRDKRVIQDPGAPPLWARFYDLADNQPFFCDRDGIKKDSLSEISYERRVGYGWYDDDPKEVLKTYNSWSATFDPKCVEPKELVTEKAVEPGLPWSHRMAETIMIDFPEMWRMEGKGLKWAYTKGLLCSAFLDLWKASGKVEYFRYAKAYADTMINEAGIIHGYKMMDYNIDKINPAKMLLDLDAATSDPRYTQAISTLREQLVNHPRTEAGGFWHKKRYPHQMWLDGLYMGAPFYARYGQLHNEPESVNEAVDWMIIMEEKARDPKTGLLYHAWDESKSQGWANKATGLASQFWSRGVGWYAMALVDILDYIPDHPRRQEIIAIVNRLAEAVVKVQDENSGVWYQVLDKPEGDGNYLEGSGSAMFAYFLLKAVKKGYINSSYLIQAKKGYLGIIEHLIEVRPDGRLVMAPICAGAGLGGDPYRDGSYEYYINEDLRDNDPKGVGPFIMASLLYEELR